MENEIKNVILVGLENPVDSQDSKGEETVNELLIGSDPEPSTDFPIEPNGAETMNEVLTGNDLEPSTDFLIEPNREETVNELLIGNELSTDSNGVETSTHLLGVYTETAAEVVEFNDPSSDRMINMTVNSVIEDTYSVSSSSDSLASPNVKLADESSKSHILGEAVSSCTNNDSLSTVPAFTQSKNQELGNEGFSELNSHNEKMCCVQIQGKIECTDERPKCTHSSNTDVMITEAICSPKNEAPRPGGAGEAVSTSTSIEIPPEFEPPQGSSSSSVELITAKPDTESDVLVDPALNVATSVIDEQTESENGSPGEGSKPATTLSEGLALSDSVSSPANANLYESAEVMSASTSIEVPSEFEPPQGSSSSGVELITAKPDTESDVLVDPALNVATSVIDEQTESENGSPGERSKSVATISAGVTLSEPVCSPATPNLHKSTELSEPVISAQTTSCSEEQMETSSNGPVEDNDVDRVEKNNVPLDDNSSKVEVVDVSSKPLVSRSEKESNENVTGKPTSKDEVNLGEKNLHSDRDSDSDCVEVIDLTCDVIDLVDDEDGNQKKRSTLSGSIQDDPLYISHGRHFGNDPESLELFSEFSSAKRHPSCNYSLSRLIMMTKNLPESVDHEMKKIFVRRSYVLGLDPTLSNWNFRVVPFVNSQPAVGKTPTEKANSSVYDDLRAELSQVVPHRNCKHSFEELRSVAEKLPESIGINMRKFFIRRCYILGIDPETHEWNLCGKANSETTDLKSCGTESNAAVNQESIGERRKRKKKMKRQARALKKQRSLSVNEGKSSEAQGEIQKSKDQAPDQLPCKTLELTTKETVDNQRISSSKLSNPSASNTMIKSCFPSLLDAQKMTLSSAQQEKFRALIKRGYTYAEAVTVATDPGESHPEYTSGILTNSRSRKHTRWETDKEAFAEKCAGTSNASLGRTFQNPKDQSNQKNQSTPFSTAIARHSRFEATPQARFSSLKPPELLIKWLEKNMCKKDGLPPASVPPGTRYVDATVPKSSDDVTKDLFSRFANQKRHPNCSYSLAELISLAKNLPSFVDPDIRTLFVHRSFVFGLDPKSFDWRLCGTNSPAQSAVGIREQPPSGLPRLNYQQMSHGVASEGPQQMETEGHPFTGSFSNRAPFPGMHMIQSQQPPLQQYGVRNAWPVHTVPVEVLPPSSIPASGSRHLTLYIVPLSYPHVKLSEEDMDAIESSVLDAIVEMDDGSMKPSFKESHRSEGQYIITCSNDFSVEWVQQLFKKCQPLPKTPLRIKTYVKSADIKANAVLPPCKNDSIEKILKFIAKQNESLKVNEWKVHQRWDNGDFNTCLELFVDEESARVLEKSSTINFKLTSAQVVVERADSSFNSGLKLGKPQENVPFKGHSEESQKSQSMSSEVVKPSHSVHSSDSPRLRDVSDFSSTKFLPTEVPPLFSRRSDQDFSRTEQGHRRRYSPELNNPFDDSSSTKSPRYGTASNHPTTQEHDYHRRCPLTKSPVAESGQSQYSGEPKSRLDRLQSEARLQEHFIQSQNQYRGKESSSDHPNSQELDYHRRNPLTKSLLAESGQSQYCEERKSGLDRLQTGARLQEHFIQSQNQYRGKESSSDHPNSQELDYHRRNPLTKSLLAESGQSQYSEERKSGLDRLQTVARLREQFIQSQNQYQGKETSLDHPSSDELDYHRRNPRTKSPLAESGQSQYSDERKSRLDWHRTGISLQEHFTQSQNQLRGKEPVSDFSSTNALLEDRGGRSSSSFLENNDEKPPDFADSRANLRKGYCEEPHLFPKSRVEEDSEASLNRRMVLNIDSYRRGDDSDRHDSRHYYDSPSSFPKGPEAEHLEQRLNPQSDEHIAPKKYLERSSNPFERGDLHEEYCHPGPSFSKNISQYEGEAFEERRSASERNFECFERSPFGKSSDRESCERDRHSRSDEVGDSSFGSRKRSPLKHSTGLSRSDDRPKKKRRRKRRNYQFAQRPNPWDPF